MNELISVFRDKNKIKKLILTTIACFVLNIIYHKIITITPVYADVEPINPVAPAFGLYLGPIGALAMMFAYTIRSVIMFSNDLPQLLFQIMGSFIYSYLPYKMWYTISNSKKCKIPNLDDARSILKYICIMCLNSMSITLMYYTVYFYEYKTIVFSVTGFLFCLFNCASFPVLLGIPIMVALSASNVNREIPLLKKNKGRTNKYIYFFLVYILLSIINLFQMVYFDNNCINIFTVVFAVIIHIIIFCYINCPFSKEVDTIINSSNKSKVTMKGKVTLGFLLFGFVLIILNVILFDIILDLVCDDKILIMKVLYVVIGVCTFYIFAITLLVLKYVETKVTIPLDKLSNAVSDYSKIKNYNSRENDDKIKKLCSSINSKNEVQEIAEEFSKMIDKIEEYFDGAKKITEERERERVEIDLASKIQESILPRNFPAFPDRNDFDIYASMTAAKKLGGDFYDFFITENNKLCFLVGDVSGKGVPAALVMMSAKTVIKDYLSMNLDIEEVVKKVNMKLCKENDVFMFITAFLAVVDLNSGKMEYVSAGHNPPLFRKADKSFEYLGVRSNCILAVDYYADFIKQEIELSHGDVLFIYTDGVTEALNKNGMFYGSDRLINCLNSKYYDDIYQMIPYVKNSMRDFTEDFTQSDDITMLIFKYK